MFKVNKNVFIVNFANISHLSSVFTRAFEQVIIVSWDESWFPEKLTIRINDCFFFPLISLIIEELFITKFLTKTSSCLSIFCIMVFKLVTDAGLILKSGENL